jgi:hypothetical protein
MKALLMVCFVAAAFAADFEVFHGVPTVRVFTTIEKESREKLDAESAKKNECVIVQRGKKYYWASRDNAEMLRVDAPQFTYFIHTGGSGYVKVLTGSRKDLNAPADYIENIVRQFEVVTYWGNVTTAGAPASPR